MKALRWNCSTCGLSGEVSWPPKAPRAEVVFLAGVDHVNESKKRNGGHPCEGYLHDLEVKEIVSLQIGSKAA